MAHKLKDPTLARDALASMATRALRNASFLGPVASALGLVKAESPAAQLASVFDRLQTRVKEGSYLRWPASLVVVLLMRIDQLEQGGRDDDVATMPSTKRLRTDIRPPLTAQPAAPWLNVAALLKEIDFGGLREAEWRALALQASSCSRQTPALAVLTQQLLMRSIKNEPPARPLYTAAAAGTFVTATLTLPTNPASSMPARVPIVDINHRENRLFVGNGQEERHAAQLTVGYDGEGRLHLRWRLLAEWARPS